MNTGLGGFGNPLRRYFKLYIWHIWHKHLPNARLPRAMTLKTTRPDKKHRRIPRPRASSFSGHHKHPTHQKDVNYISFDAIVGRNSKFINLTSEQREELGGVEYRVSIEKTRTLCRGANTDIWSLAITLLLFRL